MTTYQDVKNYVQKIADINGASAVLAWDKEVNLPAGGAAARSRQVATLSSISHSQFTDPQLKSSIDNLLQGDQLSDGEKINLIRIQRDIRIQTKFSTAFIERQSLAISKAYHAWVTARQKSDFSLYQEALDEVFSIKKEAIQILGYDEHPYDALVDQYEAGMTVSVLDRVFEQVKTELVPVIHKLAAKPQVDDSFIRDYYNENDQWEFGLKVLRRMGYDFNHGRQDRSPTHLPSVLPLLMCELQHEWMITTMPICSGAPCMKEGMHCMNKGCTRMNMVCR